MTAKIFLVSYHWSNGKAQGFGRCFVNKADDNDFPSIKTVEEHEKYQRIKKGFTNYMVLNIVPLNGGWPENYQ